jgi:hypothetical protein
MAEVDVLDVEDTVLCIDISRSMARKDIGEISRLDIIKEALVEFVEKKLKIDKRDRFSIVGFSTNAEIILQLTNEKERIVEKIQSLTPRGISGLGEGIAVSLNILSHEILQEGQNVNRVLILSDGKPWLGTIDPIEKSEMAAQLGIIVDAIEVSRSRETWGQNILESMTRLGTYHQATSKELLRLPLQTLSHKKDVYEMKKEMPKLSLIATPLINPNELNPEMKESIQFLLGEVEPTCIICRLSSCGICNQEYDCFRICPYCKNYMHLCCVAKWSETSKMIEAQVFRCPHCLMLLRLPDDIKKPKIEIAPPIEESEEQKQDTLTITSAFSTTSGEKPGHEERETQKVQLPSSLDAKIGDFVREGGRILLKELIRGEEKFIYLAWNNWGSMNYSCNLMTGMNEKICKEFRPIINWEEGICKGFKIADDIGWLSNLSYEYGILILDIDQLQNWCNMVLKNIKNIKALMEEHDEIEFSSDKLTDFQLSATVKFDAPIEIKSREELEGNLLLGAVNYLHLFHKSLQKIPSKKIEEQISQTQSSGSIPKHQGKPKKAMKEFSLDFDQMDEKLELPSNKELKMAPQEVKNEMNYRFHCPECNKWYKYKGTKDSLQKQSCPNCNKELKLGLFCPNCKKSYLISNILEYENYNCPKCELKLVTDLQE